MLVGGKIQSKEKRSRWRWGNKDGEDIALSTDSENFILEVSFLGVCPSG